MKVKKHKFDNKTHKARFELTYKTRTGKVINRVLTIKDYWSQKPPSTIEFTGSGRKPHRKRMYYFLAEANDKKDSAPRKQRIVKRNHYRGFSYWTVENFDSHLWR